MPTSIFLIQSDRRVAFAMKETQTHFKTAGFIVISSFILFFYSAAEAASVKLRWDPVSPTPQGYRVYTRKADETYDYRRHAWQGSESICTIADVDGKSDYYFVVRAYKGALESTDSNEVRYASGDATKPDAAAAKPTITPNGGTFRRSVQVSLQTATKAATIYYTTNGKKPTTRSTKYTGAFRLKSSATVKAIAVASGGTKSALARATFKKTATSSKTATSASSATSTEASTSTIPVTSATSSGGQQPYTGKPWPVPGTINAEDYDKGGEGVAYHDRSAENKGGKYRTDGVDIYYSRDSLVNYYTGANASGEWLEYTVDVAKSGTYSLDLHVATPNSGRKVSVMLDGNEDITGSIDVPNTGGWHDWETVMTTVELSAGKHVLRVVIDRGGFSFNWIDINPIGETK